MFAHYIVVNDKIVIGSSVAFIEVEWPRIHFDGASMVNLRTGRIIAREGARIVFLNPEDEGYIDPAALSAEPPAGSRVAIVKRADEVTVVGSPGSARMEVATRTCNVTMDGVSGVQIGSGNRQVLKF
ncbi:MAG: hypothetical protein PVI21_02575 [Candidatus Woesebacteria bacterium]|jgi:hypothetical protein